SLASVRNPSDLPPRGAPTMRSRRFSDKGRIALIAVAVIIVGILLFGRFFAGFFTDYLWFDSVGRAGLFSTILRSKLLMFFAFVLDWLFAALVFITLLVVATHVLSGGIIIQPPRPKVRRATKAHVAVLLAALAVVKAGDYWLTRYELTTDSRGFVRGLLYS